MWELEHSNTSHHFGLVAQLAERPVVCGRVEGATPFGSAIFAERSSVFRAPGGRAQAPWDREAAGENPAVPTNLEME